MSVPNTLTIFINTRIRNYQKIKYNPSMTVPKIKSDTVFFDPLVKLNSNIVKKKLPGQEENEKYTQFFNKNEFSSLINRTLSSSMQKKKTLEDATKEGIINNNIHITLDDLFGPGNIFYIKDKPYSIFSYEWTPGDWIIDTKSFEKKVAYIPYGSTINYSLFKEPDGRMEQAEAKRELKQLEMISPEIVSGSIAKTKYSKFKRESKPIISTATIIQPQTIQNQSKEYQEKIAKNIPKSLQTLVGKDTIIQNSINSDDNSSSIPSDPIILTILYSNDRNYSEDIKLNSDVLEPLYADLLNSKIDFNRAKNNYEVLLGTDNIFIIEPVASPVTGGGEQVSLLVQKKQFDESITSFEKLIISYKEKYSINDILNNSELKNKSIEMVQLLLLRKSDFLNTYSEVLNLLLDKIEKQKKYIEKIVVFYSKLFDVKIKDMKSKKEVDKNKIFQMEIYFQLLEFDIKTYKTMLMNPTFINYIETLRYKIKDTQKKIKLINSEQYNYREKIELYYNFPQLLTINKEELDIYILYLFEFNEENESNIWSILFFETSSFFDSIEKLIFQNISNTREIQQKYNDTYTQSQRDAYENILNKSISSNQNLLLLKSTQSSNFQKQKKDYDKLLQSIVISYDSITLYSQLATIYYSRELGLLSTKKNHTNIQIRKFNEFTKYFTNIELNPSIIDYLPLTLYWNNPTLIDEISALKENNSNMLHTVEMNDFFFNSKYDELEVKYKNMVDKLIPQISANGILTSCEQIINPTLTIIPNNVKLNEPISPSEKVLIKFNNFLENKFDFDESNSFSEELINIYYEGINDKILPEMNDVEIVDLLKGWNVYDDARAGDCFFSSIMTAFNGELVLNGKLTSNPFSDKGYYSVSSLRRAVSEGITDDIMDGWKLFKNYKDEEPDSENRRDYNFLFDEKDSHLFIGDNINIVKKNIQTPAIKGGKYWGDEIAIGILEKTFKIKIIIIETREIQSETLWNGVPIFFKKGNQTIYGTIMNVNPDNTYIILSDQNKRYKIKKNLVTPINPYYRIQCNDPDHDNYINANEYNHYIFILLKDIGNSSHYEVLYHSPQKKFIFTFEQIPDYFKYFIFKSCMKFNKNKSKNVSWFYSNDKFKQYFDECNTKYRKITGGAGPIQKQQYTRPNAPHSSDSKLSYYIIIDLELFPGKEIPFSQKAVLKCQKQYEKIRQSYADMFGLVYRPNEFYPSSYSYKEEGEKKVKNNETKKRRKYPLPYNRTRRYHS